MPTTITFDLVRRAGFTRETLAAHFGKSPLTVNRWLRQARAPRAVVELLTIYAGRLPWPGFDDVRHAHGALYVGEFAHGLTPHDLAAYPMRLHELHVLRREYDRLKRAPAQYLLDLTQPDPATGPRRALAHS